MRRLATCLALSMAAACAPVDESPFDEETDPVETAWAYVEDARIRRQALERSAAVADSDYGRLRLAHYSLSGAGIDDPARDWDLAPIIVRGAVRRLRVPAHRDEPAPPPFEAEIVEDVYDLVDLADFEHAGRLIFELCPIQIDPRLEQLRESAAVARSFGLHVTDDGEVRGAVELRVEDGRWIVALTCAGCHSTTRDDGTQVAGLPNPHLRLGGLVGSPWRPGTMDVTGDGVTNPVRPPDLRPLVHQARLHASGNLGNGRIARMVRIETLMSSRWEFEARPERRVVAAMALYLESLARGLELPDAALDGRRAFGESCAGCHDGDAMAGPPISANTVGTDPRATMGDRGTGGYRVPSLLGVAERRGLLHDGTVPDLPALLRLTPSDHTGHDFGTRLPAATRQAIIDYLR